MIHSTLLKIEIPSLNNQGIKMKKIRLVVYVLIHNLCFTSFFAESSNVIAQTSTTAANCPTSPIIIEDKISKNIHTTTPVDHATTPVDHTTTPVVKENIQALYAAIPALKSCESCASLLERCASMSISSVDDLSMFQFPSSPVKKQATKSLSEYHLCSAMKHFHPTTPVDHATTPVDVKK